MHRAPWEAPVPSIQSPPREQSPAIDYLLAHPPIGVFRRVDKTLPPVNHRPPSLRTLNPRRDSGGGSFEGLHRLWRSMDNSPTGSSSCVLEPLRRDRLLSSSSSLERPSSLLPKGGSTVRAIRKLFEGGRALPPPSPEKWSPHVPRKALSFGEKTSKTEEAEFLRPNKFLHQNSIEEEKGNPSKSKEEEKGHPTTTIVSSTLSTDGTTETAVAERAMQVKGRATTIDIASLRHHSSSSSSLYGLSHLPTHSDTLSNRKRELR